MSSLVPYTGVAGALTAASLSADALTGGPSAKSQLPLWNGASWVFPKQLYDPRAFGTVKIDGSGDNTSIFQEAINLAYEDDGGWVLVPPGICNVTQLKMKSRVGLIGYGWASQLRAKASSNVPMIVIDDVNVEMTAIMHLWLMGNRSNQSSAGQHGIYFTNSGGSGFSFNDAMHRFENVLVSNFKGVGVYAGAEARSIYAAGVASRDNDLEGYYIVASDGVWVGCEAGSNGDATGGASGFLVDGANNRLVGCKAFFNGQNGSTLAAHTGDGFWIRSSSRNTLLACEAQDNYRNGFFFDNCLDLRAEGLLADTNGRNTAITDSAGYRLDGALRAYVRGTSINRSGQTAVQNHGIKYATPASTGADVHIISKDPVTGHITGQSFAQTGRLTLNNEMGTQFPTFAANMTIEPEAGGTAIFTLTGNLTLAAPTATSKHQGSRLKLVMTQDATGGRTVTFGANFKVNWTPDTTAGKINVIEFEYNGSFWVQVGSAVNL